MKSYNNLFTKIYSYENLYTAFLLARKHKRSKLDVLKFEQYLKENLKQLQEELIFKTYQPGIYKTFYVYDPKTRLIMAAPFRDRVVHHALCNVIEPIFDSRFIDTSFACRVDMGVDAGVDKVTEYLRETRWKFQHTYCLKCDVHHYFQSVDKDILRRLLFRRIRCKETRWLIDKVLCSTDGNKGIPVGNLTSQLFANIYLDTLDHFVKETLKARYYVRYMDDFVILADDKAALHGVQNRIEVFLHDKLQLELNNRTSIFPVSHGIDFLGYRIFRHTKLLRKRYMKRTNDKTLRAWL